jgi:peptidoglycan/xylan/chitin deacetylase (PgdA/CDA1 family)
MTAIVGPGDFTGDGRVDVLARDEAGLLWLYRGNGAGGWTSPRLQVGNGWNGMTALLGPRDFSGDGKVDVLARDTTGLLWLYRGNGAGGWISPRLQVGSGWNGMTAIVGPGDFSGDGKVDVLARDSAGYLWLYRGNGLGRWISPRLQVGRAWNGMTDIVGPGDFSGDGKVDVLARDTTGLLWLYRGNGVGRWITPPLQVGSGWGDMTAIVGPGDFSGDGGAGAVDCSRVACVALTFDDGPSAYTDRLIDTLTSRDVPATFFVVGTSVEARPSTALREYRSGLPVENHTYTHAQLDLLSLSAQLTEVQRADSALVAAGVPKSVLLRPPYGSWNSSTRQLGKPLILWSVDPRDWDGRTASEIRSHVAANTTSGAIVLLHDRVSATVDAVPGIISDLRARGFTLVTVETLVPWMEPGDVVYSRSNVIDAATAATADDVRLRAPDGRVIGPVRDEAPFAPQK